MTKYEFRHVLVEPCEVSSRMEQWVNLGWEFVTIVVKDAGFVYVIFKRPFTRERIMRDAKVKMFDSAVKETDSGLLRVAKAM